MNELVRFERRITAEEADTARIRVSSKLLPRLRQMAGRLVVRVGGRVFDATLTAELCQCAGPSRPHTHEFLLLRGDGELAAADRVWIEVSPAG